ncbi:MAG TPA: AlkA N-terminal domain-containing protein [Gammaproteobacteria bacterium]
MPAAEVCERARHARDARFDGRFFIAVKSTGIYCRPVCPAPTARAANVNYFPTAAAAAEAGYRPCLRCRPETAPGTPAWQGTSTTVARGLRLIGEGALDHGSVEDLAERLGVTSRHLSRLFREHLGASPVTVAQTRRLQFAKRLIDESALSFSDIALAAGFGSLRRFNHTVRETWGRAPGELRKLRQREKPAQKSAMTLTIALRAPFDAAHWLEFLGRRAIPGVESVANGAYSRVHVSAQGTGTVSIRPLKDAAEVTVQEIPPAELFAVMRLARGLLDADADPASIAETLRRDRALAPLVKRRPGIRLPGAWNAFELAVRAVLGQQVSVAAARTLAARLVERFGDALPEPLAPALTHAFPSPERIAAATVSQLAAVGLPGKRAEALRGLAKAVVDGDVDFSATPGELREALQALSGIGAWTAQYIAMRALRDPDALPAGDLVLRQMLGGDRPLSAREVERRAEAWRPWRAYGLIHLWAKASEEKSKGNGQD